MLRQEACVERFLARRRGRASSLHSTGAELLDHGWYVLACWDGERIRWNPMPYPSASSRAIHRRAARALHGAGWGPVAWERGALARGGDWEGFPFPYHTVLERGRAPHGGFWHPDEGRAGARWELDPWDAWGSCWVYGRWDLCLVVRAPRFPRLREASLRELLRPLLLKERAHRAEAEARRLLGELEPLARALGRERDLRRAKGLPGTARLGAARRLERELKGLLGTPQGLAAAFSG